MKVPNHILLKQQVQWVRDAKQWRTNESYEDLWERMRDLYRGRQYATKSSEDRMVVNMAFPTKNVISPSVAINNPRFTVSARKPEGAAQAVITEHVLNYVWQTFNYHDEFRLAVDDFITFGFGWVKVGYVVPKPPETVKVPDAPADDAYGVDDHTPTPVSLETQTTVFDDVDRPTVERIAPKDIFVDPDATRPSNMRWIAQRVRRAVNDVRVDSRYDKKAREAVGGGGRNESRDDEVYGDEDGSGNSDVAYVDVFEFYDLRRKTVSTFAAESSERFLIEPAEIPFAFGHPFVMLRNYEVADTFYPMGDLEAIEILQQELNATRSQMMNHRKKYQRKYLYRKDAFSAKGLDSLRSDKDNEMVEVDSADPLGDVLAPLPQVGTPPEFYNQSSMIQEDIDRVSGVSDYMRGAQANIRRTATEAAMIQDAQNARAADKLGRIESALAQIGRRIIQLMQQFMTGERVVRIVGGQNPVWVNFDVDYISGEFDFSVEGGSTQPRNESYRRQQALQFVDAVAPFLQMGVINPLAAVRYVLQFGFDIHAPDEFLMDPQMGPMGGGPPPGPPPGGPQSEPPPDQESPIQGIPPELVNQLSGQFGLPTG